MGGVGMQQLFIIIFSLLTVQVLLAVHRETTGDRQQKAVMLLYTVLAVLALITVSSMELLLSRPAQPIPIATHNLPHVRICSRT
jgi:hypothetical protein